jgi:hypothetical protein
MCIRVGKHTPNKTLEGRVSSYHNRRPLYVPPGPQNAPQGKPQCELEFHASQKTGKELDSDVLYAMCVNSESRI